MCFLFQANCNKKLNRGCRRGAPKKLYITCLGIFFGFTSPDFNLGSRWCTSLVQLYTLVKHVLCYLELLGYRMAGHRLLGSSWQAEVSSKVSLQSRRMTASKARRRAGIGPAVGRCRWCIFASCGATYKSQYNFLGTFFTLHHLQLHIFLG
jgi:hypothetical protein